MKNLSITLALAMVVFISCTGFDVDEGALLKQEKEYAEQTLGFHIDDNHTWNMEATVNVTVTQYPANFTPVEFVVYDSNPLADSTATIVAQTDDLNSPLSFDSPSYLHTLYAGCTDADGNMRVVPFKATDSYVDFTAPAYKTVSQPASTRGITRAAVDELNWQPSYNAQDLAADGWTDQIAIISGGSEAREFEDRAEIFSTYTDVFRVDNSGNSGDRILHFDDAIRTYYYAKVGKGGGSITVTPVGTSGTQSSPMFFGYYYFEKGQTHEVKKVRKFLFDEEYKKLDKAKTFTSNTCKSFKLVYYDENGDASYNFPEGTEVGFFCRVSFKGHTMEWYAEGENNIDRSLKLLNDGQLDDWNKSHDWWKEANHVLYYQRNGIKYVGIEDWVDNFNMQDIVMVLDGNVEDFPALDKPKSTPNHHIYTFAFEDTKNGDFDLNDVVIQVYRGASWATGRGINGLHIRLVALGAQDPIKAYFKDMETGEITPLFEGKELHEAFGLEDMSFVNTESINYVFSKAEKNNNTSNSLHTFVTSNDNRIIWENVTSQDIYIVNERTHQEVHTPRSQGWKGGAPYGICIPYAWAWPKEHVAITKAYPMFARYATSVESGVIDVTDWYVTPNDGKTLFYEFGFTVQ